MGFSPRRKGSLVIENYGASNTTRLLEHITRCSCKVKKKKGNGSPAEADLNFFFFFKRNFIYKIHENILKGADLVF